MLGQQDGWQLPGKPIAPLIRVDAEEEGTWRPEELRMMLAGQLAAPLTAVLPGLPPRPLVVRRSDLRTFSDLFQHPAPPVELLREVRDYAKALHRHPLNTMPPEVTAVLYYASIVAARFRAGATIADAGDDEIRQGLEWVLAQTWLDDHLRQLLAAGQGMFG